MVGRRNFFNDTTGLSIKSVAHTGLNDNDISWLAKFVLSIQVDVDLTVKDMKGFLLFEVVLLRMFLTWQTNQ